MITIRADRSAFIPQGEECIGYESDNLAESRQFAIHDQRLTDCAFRIDIENTSDIVIPVKSVSEDGTIILRWDITAAMLGSGGVVTVQIRAFDTDSTLIWHSAPIDFYAGRSVHAVNECSDEATVTEFEQIEQQAESTLAACENCVDEAQEILDDLIEEVGDVSEISRTLNAHIADTDNPHEVTAADIGAYTIAETDTLLDGKLNVSNGTALGNLYVAGGFHVVDIDSEKAIDINPITSVISFEKPGTVSGLAQPSNAVDAANKGYVDSAVGTKISKNGDTMTGPLTVSDTDLDQSATLCGSSLTFDSPAHVYNLALPSVADEAVSKRYVDGCFSDYHAPADLTDAFAGEIAGCGGNAWAWIKRRITQGDFSGIRIGDCIPFTMNGKAFHAEIAGINTYKGSGDVEIRNHIDFITRELHYEGHRYNPVRFNNGTKFGDAAATDSPWLASDVYLWLNALSGTVASEAAAGGGTGTAVDYTASGVFTLLPAALRAVITEKRFYAEKRFHASTLRTSSQGNAWISLGKLWLPNEYELFGSVIRGTKTTDAYQSSVQYPIFQTTEARIKRRAGTTTRATWSIMQPVDLSSETICGIHSSGYSVNAYADSILYYPICFRIEADAPSLTAGAPHGDGDDA